MLGLITTVVGFMSAHFTGLDDLDNIGREIYPWIPRGWVWELAGQIVSIGGAVLVISGLTLALLYERKMTWARAAIGAVLFTALMLIVYGVVPNQWLTLSQAEWEWTSAKIAVTLPPLLVFNNEVAISYEVIKDSILQGYILGVTGALAVTMHQWQERQKKRAEGPPPKPVSVYGRPMTKIGRG